MAERSEGRLLRGWRAAAWGAAAALLLLPAAAMQVTDEVNWTLSDFAFAGALLLGTGLAYEFAAWGEHDVYYRAGIGAALATAFILIWANGAVGIIGSETNPANLVFGAVLAVAAPGAAVARLGARGLARAMVATALAQALVSAIALIAGWGSASEIVPMATFFIALWLTAAGLFEKAARRSFSGTAR